MEYHHWYYRHTKKRSKQKICNAEQNSNHKTISNGVLVTQLFSWEPAGYKNFCSFHLGYNKFRLICLWPQIQKVFFVVSPVYFSYKFVLIIWKLVQHSEKMSHDTKVPSILHFLLQMLVVTLALESGNTHSHSTWSIFWSISGFFLFCFHSSRRKPQLSISVPCE